MNDFTGCAYIAFSLYSGLQERMTLKHTSMAKWAKNQLSKDVKDHAVCVTCISCGIQFNIDGAIESTSFD